MSSHDLSQFIDESRFEVKSIIFQHKSRLKIFGGKFVVKRYCEKIQRLTVNLVTIRLQ